MFNSVKTHACLLALMLGLPSANAQEAAPQIPAQFRATWAVSPDDCHGGNLVIVQAAVITAEGGESGWTLKKIIQSDPTTFVAIYDFGGEDFYEPGLRISLRLLPDGKLLADFTKPTLFERCNENH